MIGLIGRKVGMTQIFSDKGEALPVTVIEAGPCTVTELRTAERDGYTAAQLGFGAKRESRVSRPVLGQFKKHNLPPTKSLREFRVADASGLEVGQSLTVAIFEKGTRVNVEGITKGRGFTGVVKRHGFVAGHATLLGDEAACRHPGAVALHPSSPQGAADDRGRAHAGACVCRR